MIFSILFFILFSLFFVLLLYSFTPFIFIIFVTFITFLLGLILVSNGFFFAGSVMIIVNAGAIAMVFLFVCVLNPRRVVVQRPHVNFWIVLFLTILFFFLINLLSTFQNFSILTPLSVQRSATLDLHPQHWSITFMNSCCIFEYKWKRLAPFRWALHIADFISNDYTNMPTTQDALGVKRMDLLLQRYAYLHFDEYNWNPSPWKTIKWKIINYYNNFFLYAYELHAYADRMEDDTFKNTMSNFFFSNFISNNDWSLTCHLFFIENSVEFPALLVIIGLFLLVTMCVSILIIKRTL